MIGLIGANGLVGKQVLAGLLRLTTERIRIGSRNVEVSKEKESSDRLEYKKVDITDEASIDNFLEGMILIVNCAGPSCYLSGKIANICFVRQIDYVDAGIHKVYGNLSQKKTDAVMMYGSGATPGLSGLLPVWLGKQFDMAVDFRYYYGSFGIFSTSSARDYLNGAYSEENQVRVAWHDGEKKNSFLTQKEEVKLPFFPYPVMLSPYFDQESEAAARKLSLKNGEWNIAFMGKTIQGVLKSGRMLFKEQPEQVTENLCKASQADAAGKEQYMIFLMEMRGIYQNQNVQKTLLVKAEDPTLITGTAVVAAVDCILKGKAKKGVYPFSESGLEEEAVQILKETRGIELELLDISIEDCMIEEDGEI